MAAYRRVDDLQSLAGRLPVHRDQLWAQRSETSMGSLLAFFLKILNVWFWETQTDSEKPGKLGLLKSQKQRTSSSSTSIRHVW